MLARDFQQQLFFPFRLSSQHYSRQGMQLAASLAPLLHNEQLAAFMQAMNDVTYPSQRWEAWHAQLQQLVGKGRQVGRGCTACCSGTCTSTTLGCTCVVLAASSLPRCSSSSARANRQEAKQMAVKELALHDVLSHAKVVVPVLPVSPPPPLLLFHSHIAQTEYSSPVAKPDMLIACMLPAKAAESRNADCLP